MKNIVTHATVFTDGRGLRLSYGYCQVDEQTGLVQNDNLRRDILIFDEENKALLENVLELAQTKLDLTES